MACEFSGIVRDAFLNKGHDAISCDLLPTESPGPHFQGDVREILNQEWDLLIAHPPCTHLCISGARWFAERQEEQKEAIAFFMLFVRAIHISKRCIENPVGIMSTVYHKPTQYIEPWQFGHDESKKTGLWLYGDLPILKPTDLYLYELSNRIHTMQPGPDRSRLRSLTYTGIADAMADQWG